MTAMNKADLIKLIEQEIEWCRKNKEAAPDKSFGMGFIKGLEQAIEIIKKSIK